MTTIATSEPFPTKVAIARHYRVNERTVHRWVNHQDWPDPATPESVDHFLNMIGSPAGSGDTEDPVDDDELTLSVAKVLKVQEEIRKLRIDNDLKEGLLVDRHEAERAWAEAVLEAKARIEQIPDELAMLFPAEIRGQLTLELRSKIHLILKVMAGAELPA